MPIALLAAFAGSLALHAAALFLPDVELSPVPKEEPLQAELRLPPLPAPPVMSEPPKPTASPNKKKVPPPAAATHITEAAAPMPEPTPGAVMAAAPTSVEASPAVQPQSPPPPPPVQPLLPVRGAIRYDVFKGTDGLMVGRAVHEWFFIDGTYRIKVTTETTGLAALFKSIRVEMESSGKLVAGGLQPERLTTRRNGAETNENVGFDWATRQATFARDGRQVELPEGAQDVVSFQYQLAFVPQLANGTDLGIATGKKLGRYRIEALGEEMLETPAGVFRTLHVRARTDDSTELWLALDREMLPVKIRYTDRKGESFETVAVELGMPLP